jgi:putative endonuclease
MKKERHYYIYIMTNAGNSTLYIGVTNNLERRIFEHKQKLVEGFTKRYNLIKLAYFEDTNDVGAAITREKELKGWTRKKKNSLIHSMNPTWRDLAEEWYGDSQDPSPHCCGTQDDNGKI